MSENTLTKGWKFEWLTTWDEVWTPSFLEQWKSWMEESPSAHVFFHPSIVRAWVGAYIAFSNIQPRFLIARFDSDCTVFMPLILMKNNWKNAWQRSILPVGYSDFDYHDPIMSGNCSLRSPTPSAYGDAITWTSFWEAFDKELTKTWRNSYDVVIVDGLRQDYIPDSLPHTAIDICPYIDLSSFQSSEEFLLSLKGKQRGDILRQRRRLEEQGTLKHYVFGGHEIEAAMNILPEILAEHTRKWPKSYKAPGFHENLIKYGFSAGVLRMSELRLNDEPISWHIGFLYQNRFYWYLPVYKPEFSQYSPGKLHLYLCIEDALSKGANIFDLLRGDESYKTGWTKESISLFELRWQSRSMISSARNLWIKEMKLLFRKITGRA